LNKLNFIYSTERTMGVLSDHLSCCNLQEKCYRMW